MKTEKAILDEKEIEVVVDFDDDLIEEVYFDKENNDNLEDTLDLSDTLQFAVENFHE